jgi:hypothetical protein
VVGSQIEQRNLVSEEAYFNPMADHCKRALWDVPGERVAKRKGRRFYRLLLIPHVVNPFQNRIYQS